MSEETFVNPETGETSVRDNLEASKSHALQAAEELRAAASAKAAQLKEAAETRAQQVKDVANEKAQFFKGTAEERAGQVREFADNTWEDAQGKAKDFQVDAEKYIRENPTKAVLTALGVGFLVGVIFRR